MSTQEFALDNLQVSYVKFNDVTNGYVYVHLDVDGLKVTEIAPLTAALSEKLDFVTDITPSFCDGYTGVTLTMYLQPIGDSYGSRVYDSSARRERLIEVLNPACVRKINASARVVRENRRHVQTEVTLTLADGEKFAGLKVKQYDGTNGVLRATTLSDARTIVFTMENPVANDETGDITAVVEAFAAKINALVTRPITVVDDDERAALNPANDYKSAVVVGADA